MNRIEAYEQKIELEEDSESDVKLTSLFGPTRPVYQKEAPKGIYSEIQALGAEIWPLLEPYKNIPPEDPEKRKKWRPFTYSALLGIMKRKGARFAYEIYLELKESSKGGKVDNLLALFLWKIQTCKVELKEL